MRLLEERYDLHRPATLLASWGWMDGSAGRYKVRQSHTFDDWSTVDDWRRRDIPKLILRDQVRSEKGNVFTPLLCTTWMEQAGRPGGERDNGRTPLLVASTKSLNHACCNQMALGKIRRFKIHRDEPSPRHIRFRGKVTTVSAIA